MKKYWTEFYKESWSETSKSWKRKVLKGFYVYAFDYEAAERYARRELYQFQIDNDDLMIAYSVDDNYSREAQV